MKNPARFLITAYGLSFTFFTLLFYYKIPDCTGYWMHDAYVDYTFEWLIIHNLYLFILPILTRFTQIHFKIQTSQIVFYLHLILAVVSLTSLAIAFNKTCEAINGGHYMFITSGTILMYYLTKFTAFLVLCYIIYKTAFEIFKKRKLKGQQSADSQSGG